MPVLLKRWDPLFDPDREQLGAGPVWVRLPGLPWQFWSPYVFKRIGDTLGTYLEHDRSYENTGKRTMARILVHMDTRPGLEEVIEIYHSHVTRKQILDYEGVPFRCHRCHKTGHLFKDCPLNSGGGKESSHGTRGHPPAKPKAAANSKEDVPVHGDRHTKGPGDGGKKRSSRKFAVPSSEPPRTRSKTAEAAAKTMEPASSHSGKEMRLLTSFRKRRRIVL